jgi:hypothetical protein
VEPPAACVVVPCVKRGCETVCVLLSLFHYKNRAAEKKLGWGPQERGETPAKYGQYIDGCGGAAARRVELQHLLSIY